MMTPMLGLWLLSGTALALSIAALYAARRSSVRSLLLRLNALSERLTLAETFAETQQDLVKDFLRRERQAENMRKFRERQKATEQEEPAASSNGSGTGRAATEAEKDEWQRTMNMKILTGEIRPPGRR